MTSETAPNRRQLMASFLGRIGYDEALRRQHAARERVLGGAGGQCLLLLEHPPVITLGRSARRSDVVATDAWLAARGVRVVECDRGGQVTYHGPGQLVGYPVIDLNPDRRDVRRYVRDLQRVLVETLRSFGVDAEPRHEADQIGVWVGHRKIASIGVHLRRWVTTHGFALNVTTDLTHFDAIVPCGLSEVQMTSIESLTSERPSLESVAAVAANSFADVFDCELRAQRSDEPGPGRLVDAQR